MHMSDALLSPAVGATMWASSAATTAYCARRVREMDDPARIPLMGVAGAFVFAAQMINFTIPGTGSSGHLGGGLLLAILLGPEAAFLVMASILTVQALFFADGGLLALGANVFNLGFFPAFIAYPLVYRPIAGDGRSRSRVVGGAVLAAVVALQLGAFAVVLQTTLSGVSALPFAPFALLMQPIHLVIGVVEGLVTAAVVLFVGRAQPELLRLDRSRSSASVWRQPVLIGLLISALVVAGALSLFASERDDGLEWSIARLTGGAELAGESGAHRAAGDVQRSTAWMSGYSTSGTEAEGESSWPATDPGTSLAGIVGAALVLCLALVVGFVSRRRGRPPGPGRSTDV